jgi:acetyl esterase/lipase
MLVSALEFVGIRLDPNHCREEVDSMSVRKAVRYGVASVLALLGSQFVVLGIAQRSSDIKQHDNKAQTFNIWPGAAQGSEDATQVESTVAFPLKPGEHLIRNVTVPTLTLVRPAKGATSSTAVIIAPGGGFRFLSIDDEGYLVANWLADHGITSFVLKYRVSKTPAKDEEFIPSSPNPAKETPAEALARWGSAMRSLPRLDMDKDSIQGIADGIQAVKFVRQHAAEFGVAPDKIVFLGFSAGAMVTSGTILQPDLTGRPNYAAPIYGAPFGKMPDIPTNLPPVFMAYAADDPIAGTAAERFFIALRQAKYNPELHVYSGGLHGFGMAHLGTTSDHWIQEFYWWMESNGLTGK